MNASSASAQSSRASFMRSGRSSERAIGEDGKLASVVFALEIISVPTVGFGAISRRKSLSVSASIM